VLLFITFIIPALLRYMPGIDSSTPTRPELTSIPVVVKTPDRATAVVRCLYLTVLVANSPRCPFFLAIDHLRLKWRHFSSAPTRYSPAPLPGGGCAMTIVAIHL